MRDTKPRQVALGVVTLCALGWLFLSLRGGWPLRISSQPHEAAGEVLAKQALSLLRPGGEIIVIARDTATFKNPATDIQLASFRKALRRGHATIGAIRLLQVDPLRQVEVPPGDFEELLRKTPAGNVIVSFMGPPLLGPAQRSRLGEIKPRVVAFCSGSLPERVDLRWLFEQGLLHAAVVSRHDVSSSVAKPRTSQEWFDRFFVAITPANLAELPPRAGAGP